MSKKQIRTNFRNEVLKRDGYKCRCCGLAGYDRQETPIEDKVPLDAHHILERTQDNYVKENGIAVCDQCHLKAEKYHITNGKEWEIGFHPNDLFELIKSDWRI